MSDIGSDLEAGLGMAYTAQESLIIKERAEGRNPADHKLISYLFSKNSIGSEKEWQALLRRFSRDPSQPGNVRGAPELAYAVAQYLLALQIALGEREPPEATSTETKATTSGPFEVPGFTDDDFPF